MRQLPGPMGVSPAAYKSRLGPGRQALGSVGLCRRRCALGLPRRRCCPVPAPSALAQAQPLSLPSSPQLPDPAFCRSGAGAGLMMPSESGTESRDQAAAQVGTATASAVATAAPIGGGTDPEASSTSLGRHLSRLAWPQVKRLDALLSEPIPIHGRGNFPTLSVQPRQIVQVRGTGREYEGLAAGSLPESVCFSGQLGKRGSEKERGCKKNHKALMVVRIHLPLHLIILPHLTFPSPGPEEPQFPSDHSPVPWLREGRGMGRDLAGEKEQPRPRGQQMARQPWVGRRARLSAESSFSSPNRHPWGLTLHPLPLSRF